MFHVLIKDKGGSYGEAKLDLDKDELKAMVLSPYKNGDPLFINGRTIYPDNIKRITIGESPKRSEEIIKELQYQEQQSSVAFLGGPSYEQEVPGTCKNITDQLLKGPPGYSKKKDATEKSQKLEQIVPNKVFVVHGHDKLLKISLENFLHQIGIEPIVLHRQADQGMTVIEKFEKHANVKYAFILATPDDISFNAKDLSENKLKASAEGRARQNVIFEWGYFVGKLGRDKTCCLFKKGTTLPSDLSGLVYKEIVDNVEEKGFMIIKELKAAGLNPVIK